MRRRSRQPFREIEEPNAAIGTLHGERACLVLEIGFGTFKVSVRPERKARNPQTGKEMQLPKTNVPKFTASKNLKDSLNP